MDEEYTPTPDQYRREGFQAGIEAAKEACRNTIKNYDVMEPGKPDHYASRKTQYAAKSMVRLAIQEISAIDVDEVLARLPLDPDAKENEQCQAFIERATGATINGLHGSGADAPAAVDNNHPAAVARLVEAARAEAEKAMRKFPQPNYVISKVAEEAGEVVKAAIHCAEGRETPEAVRAEIVQAMAMLIRLYLEGDQVHGLPALAATETSHDG